MFIDNTTEPESKVQKSSQPESHNKVWVALS